MTIQENKEPPGSSPLETDPTAADQLILVDEADNILDYCSKMACHQGAGKLHRAFSIFLFNRDQQLLIQQRSELKPLWPLFWSNSVCSHPRRGENDTKAAHRRLKEELGIDTILHHLFKFQYQATYLDIGSENELCSVYIGRFDGNIQANPTEIKAWRYIALAQLENEIKTNPGTFTPWFKIEWQRLYHFFRSEIRALALDPEKTSNNTSSC